MLDPVERRIVEFIRNHEGPVTITAPGGGKDLYGITIKVQDRKTAHDIALALQDHFNRVHRQINTIKR